MSYMLSRNGNTKVPQIFFSYKSQYVLVQLLAQVTGKKKRIIYKYCRSSIIMVDWVSGVQREAEEWSHPVQDMRKMNSEREREESFR